MSRYIFRVLLERYVTADGPDETTARRAVLQRYIDEGRFPVSAEVVPEVPDKRPNMPQRDPPDWGQA